MEKRYDVNCSGYVALKNAITTDERLAFLKNAFGPEEVSSFTHLEDSQEMFLFWALLESQRDIDCDGLDEKARNIMVGYSASPFDDDDEDVIREELAKFIPIAAHISMECTDGHGDRWHYYLHDGNIVKSESAAPDIDRFMKFAQNAGVTLVSRRLEDILWLVKEFYG